MFGVCVTSFLALSDHEVGLRSESPQTRWMVVIVQHASLIVLTHIDVPECVGLYTLHHVTDHVIPMPVDVATRV
jgi:hypothetical protein